MVSGPSVPNRDRQEAVSSTYFITFVCYGAWLHGTNGAVDRRHNVPGSPLPAPNPGLLRFERESMKAAPYVLDDLRRNIVLNTILEVAAHRKWTLLAAHVRTNHVHAVIQADDSPDKVMNAFKSYASRALNRMSIDGSDRRRWARHGSTRYLWTKEQVSAAIHYVICEQGEPMAVFQA